MFKQLITLLSMFFIILSFSAQAQSIIECTLIDSETNEVIPSATYRYDQQKGVSDVHGRFSLQLKPQTRLWISHVSYGELSYSTEELTSFENYTIKLQKQLFDFHPITVIAVKGSPSFSDKLTIDYEDRMSHDAALILAQNVAVNGIRKSASYGFDPVIRGFKYQQLNVVIDGAQSATAACPNRMDPPTSQIASNMSERIEILKGPHALRYGVGLGGTINVVSIKPTFSENWKSNGRFSSGYEANGNIVRTEAFTEVTNQSISLGLFGSWSEGTDYESGNGSAIASNFLRSSFGTHFGLNLTPTHYVRVSATYNRASDTEFPALPMDLRKDQTWLFNAKHHWDIQTGALQKMQTTFYGSFVDHLMDNLLRDLNPRTMNASTPAKSSTLGGRTELSWAWKQTHLFTGFDSKMESTEGIREREMLMGPMVGTTLFDNAWQHGFIYNQGIFAEWNHLSGKHAFTFSTRLDLNHATIKDPSNEFLASYSNTDATQLNPSVSAGWNYTISPYFSTSLWLARVQRSASLTERFINYFPIGIDPFELVGDPTLSPEINNQVDASFQFQRGSHVLKTDVFVAYLQNAITSYIDTSLTPRIPSSPGVRRFSSVGKALKTGFEMSWVQTINTYVSHGTDLAFTWGQDLELNEPLPEIAPLDLRYHIKTQWLKKQLSTFLQIRYVSEQTRISREFGESKSPSFTLVDGSISYTFPFNVKLTAGINNIFNVNYFEHLNRVNRTIGAPIFAPGRNIFTSISAHF